MINVLHYKNYTVYYMIVSYKSKHHFRPIKMDILSSNIRLLKTLCHCLFLTKKALIEIKSLSGFLIKYKAVQIESGQVTAMKDNIVI